MGDWVALGSRTNFLVGRLEGESARKTTNQIASARKCLILLSAIYRLNCWSAMSDAQKTKGASN